MSDIRDFQIENGILTGYLGEGGDVTIPDGVTSIRDWAFEDCKKLKSIIIPDSVNQSYEQAFDIRMLALMFLLDTLQINDTRKQNLKIQVTAKKFRTKLIPELIERNESGAVQKFLSLVKKMPPKEIDLYIEKAENNAESRVILLNHKNLLYPPEVLEQMEEIRMEKDFGLREKDLSDYRKDFTIAKKDGFYVISKYKSENPTAIIPGNIKGIPVQFTEKTFLNKEHLQSVLIEDGIAEIVDHAFFGCLHFQNITIPASVTAIGDKAFYGRQKYITISAPEGSFAAEYAKKEKIKFQAI
ncbi:MAG: leucine-rich repeat protein [Clostridia bacterium]|nr:leucine-rich repeat protein [Clostridia bacterium]